MFSLPCLVVWGYLKFVEGSRNHFFTMYFTLASFDCCCTSQFFPHRKNFHLFCPVTSTGLWLAIVLYIGIFLSNSLSSGCVKVIMLETQIGWLFKSINFPCSNNLKLILISMPRIQQRIWKWERHITHSVCFFSKHIFFHKRFQLKFYIT